MTASPARLANRILLGLLIGLVAGLLTLALGHFRPAVLDTARAVATTVLDPLGQVFLRLLFFVVIPLVFASLASGVNQLGDFSRLGSLAWRTFALFLLNMVVGVALGLAMMNLLQPGAQVDPVSRDRLMAAFASDGADPQKGSGRETLIYPISASAQQAAHRIRFTQMHDLP